MITLVLKIASWAVLACGLYLSGKLSATESDSEATPPLAIREDLSAADWARPLRLKPERDGTLEMRLALHMPGRQEEIERIEDWMAREIVRVDVTVDDGVDPKSWRIGPKVEVVGTHGAENLFILAEREFDLSGGKTYAVTARMDERDLVLVDYGFLRIGTLAPDTTYDPAARDSLPGLLLLGGGAGVFMQIFFILARLAVPMRPLEDLILED